MTAKKKSPRERELVNRRRQARKVPARKIGAAPAKKAKATSQRTSEPKTKLRKPSGEAASSREKRSAAGTKRVVMCWPSEIKIGQRFRKKYGDIKGLAGSINVQGGLLQPIVIQPDKTLVAGERRLMAWQHEACEFRTQKIPCYVVNLESIIAGEYAENADRENFTPSEAVAIKRALMPKLKAAAKERQRAAGRKKKQSDLFESGEFPQTDRKSARKPVRAVAEVARAVGKDRRTIEKAEQVVEAAEADPERFGPLKEAMDKSGRVDAPYRRLKAMRQSDAIRATPPPLPMNGPYRSGKIDPPWPAEPGEDDPDRLARGYYPYPTMSLEELAKIDVGSICHEDCVIGLWITNYHLVHGHHLPLLKAWGGFKPWTIRTWAKDRMGRGKVRGQSEHEIIAYRGKPVMDAVTITTLFHAPANHKAHSQKPQVAYDDFETAFPSERYFSLFETTDRGPKWDCHGDEVGKHACPQSPEDRPAADDAGDRGAAGSEPVTDSERDASSLQLDVPSLSSSSTPDGERREGGNFFSNDQIGEALDAISKGDNVGEDILAALARGGKGKLINGKKAPRLTKAGEDHLKVWLFHQNEKQLIAELSDDLDALSSDYQATLARRHKAVMGPEWQHIEGTSINGMRDEIVARETRHLIRLQAKANGGTEFGVACAGSPAETLRAAAAAPIGEVPMWGQRGIFRLEVDGVVCLVMTDENFRYEVYASDDAPFISSTGYKSFVGELDPPYGVTVDEQARAYVAEEIVTPAHPESAKRKPRKGGLPRPSDWYRLPKSWDEASRPVRVGAVLDNDIDADMVEWKALAAIEADVAIIGPIIEGLKAVELITERSFEPFGRQYNQPFALTQGGVDRLRELDVRFASNNIADNDPLCGNDPGPIPPELLREPVAEAKQ